MFRRVLRTYWPFLILLAFGIAGAIRARLPLAETARSLMVTLAVIAAVIIAGRQIGKGPWI